MKLEKFSPFSISTLLFLSSCFLSFQFCAEGFTIFPAANGTKILGGTLAAEKSFPFQVYIEVRDPKGSKNVEACSGSIIKHSASENRYKILTAAHCFDAILENNKPSDKNVLTLLILGVNNFATQQERGKIYEIKYDLVKIHPAYDPKTNANDLAIIPLPEKFKPVPGLYDAIGLPPPADANRNYAGTDVKLAGWGVKNSHDEDSEDLLFIQTKILADEPCEKARVESKSRGLYNSNFLCTDGTGELGACQGDSGGPLVAGTPSVVVGISSYLLTPLCKGTTPSYFIRVVKYLAWINTTI